jgi:pimeloyl-ACP methyl ester carboxylesterase
LRGLTLTASRRIRVAAIASLIVPALAAVAVGIRKWIMPRRDPSRMYDDFQLTTGDGVSLAARLIPGGDKGAVIITHPAATGQRFPPLVSLAEIMADHFDVYTFDFRGHGWSEGVMELSLSGPLEDMCTVISEVRSRGYPWVGAVGFSLGGMSAFVHTAIHGDLDAVVTVGAPPRLPDVEPYRHWLPLWSMWLRFLGTRFRAVSDNGPLPMEVAANFPDVPLLIIHGEHEAFYSRDDFRHMLSDLKGGEELWLIEGGRHTELKGKEREVVEWMVEKSQL